MTEQLIELAKERICNIDKQILELQMEKAKLSNVLGVPCTMPIPSVEKKEEENPYKSAMKEIQNIKNGSKYYDLTAKDQLKSVLYYYRPFLSEVDFNRIVDMLVDDLYFSINVGRKLKGI